MRRWWQLEVVHMIGIIFVLFGAIMFESVFLRDHHPHTTLSLFSGISVAIMLMYRQKVYPYVAIAAFSGFFIKGVLFIDFGLMDSFIFSSGRVMISLVVLEVSRQLIFKSRLLDVLKTHKVESLLLFISIAAIAAMISALMSYLFCAFFGPTIIEGPICLFSSFFSVFLGIAFFTSLLYLATVEQHTGLLQTSTLKFLVYGIMLSIFVVINLLLYRGINEFIFTRHLYIITSFFVISALLFSYRCMFMLTFIFLMMYGIIYHEATWSDATFISEAGTLYAFLFVTLMISIMLKEYIETQQEHSKNLKQMNRQLQKTLDYVHKFFSLSKKIITDEINHELHARETFDLTNMLFEEADGAFAYFEHNGEIDMLSSKHYPIKRVPLLFELHNSEQFAYEDVVYIEHIGNKVKSLYQNSTILSKFKYLTNGKRIYLVFHFDINKLMIVGLDFYKNPKKLKDSTIQRIRDFNSLINKLFAKQQISKQNRILKDDIIRSFVRTLDLYDRYTKGHSEDVAYLSKAIASELSDDTKFINDVYWAGLLHDIGKLGVEYQILNKNGKLNDDEYTHIKDHVMHSYNILIDNDDLRDIAVMVRDHHERIDGRGYPRGVKHEDISLGGKIIAVADAVATMATNRPYRKRLDKATIQKELITHQGTQFSEEITTIMNRLIDENILEKIN